VDRRAHALSALRDTGWSSAPDSPPAAGPPRSGRSPPPPPMGSYSPGSLFVTAR
jgi:hypothetical protein